MKTLTMSALIATTSILFASASYAESYNVRSSDGAGCSQNETNKGQMEFGTEMNTATQEGSVFAKWTIQLGGKKVARIDCNRLFNITVASQQLELEKARLELDLLRAQIAAAKAAADRGEVAASTGDDW